MLCNNYCGAIPHCPPQSCLYFLRTPMEISPKGLFGYNSLSKYLIAYHSMCDRVIFYVLEINNKQTNNFTEDIKYIFSDFIYLL